MAKKRMGSDPLAAVIQKTGSAAPMKKITDPREGEIRRFMKAGRFTHYYKKADGGLLQKFPIYFDAPEVVRLKIRAAQERRTVSDLVRRIVSDYLAKA